MADETGSAQAVAIDTTNYQLVAVRGQDVFVMLPKPVMTKKQALLHAAWLVSLAEESDGEFAEVLKAVQNT